MHVVLGLCLCIPSAYVCLYRRFRGANPACPTSIPTRRHVSFYIRVRFMHAMRAGVTKLRGRVWIVIPNAVRSRGVGIHVRVCVRCVKPLCMSAMFLELILLRTVKRMVLEKRQSAIDFIHVVLMGRTATPLQITLASFKTNANSKYVASLRIDCHYS